ncbi:MAG: ATP-binding protein [Bacteroidaceae bacterium]|nr:ATP-binding protein [Bacteroidaceae bacterium]
MSKRHLIIKNVGPIKEVQIVLNKVNVFIGPQSSGKSTIAKIISYCLWIEKTVCLFRPYLDIQTEFRQKMEEYHHLHGYFKNESLIRYDSEFVTISYEKGYGKVTKKEPLSNQSPYDYLTYKRPKIVYAPAERLLAAIRNWTSLKLPNDNLNSFLSEWGEMRGLFTEKRHLSVTPLRVEYHYDENSLKDYVATEEGNVELTDASSGIQSFTPLYLLHKVYNDYREELSKKSSFEDNVTLNKVYSMIHYHTTTRYPIENPPSDTFRYENQKFCVVEPGMKEKAIVILDNYTKIQYVQSIIEEPELNLFPSAQQEMVYELLTDTANSDNTLTLTTHSPYILFAINNCMMGGMVGQHIPTEERDLFPSHHAWISPSLVSIYEIHDGQLKSIQDEDGIIEDNYLNQAYKENSSEYLSLLNYYEDEE